MTNKVATPTIELTRDPSGSAAQVLIGGERVRIVEQDDDQVFVECHADDIEGLAMVDFPGDLRIHTAFFDAWRFNDDTMCFLVYCEPDQEKMDRWGTQNLFDAILGQLGNFPMFDVVACYAEFVSLEAYIHARGTVAEAVRAIDKKLLELVDAADAALAARATQ
jgi:hypothetical protein